MRYALLFALTLAAAGGGSACTPSLAQDLHATPVDAVTATRARLTIAPIRPATTTTLVHLPAVVDVPETARHHLAPPLDGLLVSLDITIGSAVAPGSPLATVRTPELMALAASESEWRQVARERDRYAEQIEAHVASGFSSALPLYEAQLAADEAEASASRARRERQAATSWVPDPDGDGTWQWQSQVTGVITDVRCSVGSRLVSGEPCVDIVDVDATEVVVHVPERYLAHVTPGVRLAFHPADGTATRTLTYRRSAPTLDPISRSRAIYFDARSAEGEALVVGASGRGELLTDVATTAFAVPTGAVTDLEGEDVLFVDRGEDQLPEAVAVEVIGRHGEDLIVTAEQLVASDQIVEAGAFLLKSIALLGSES